MRLVELLIEYSALSLDRPFTYSYKENKKLEKGYRVLIPFNNQELVGYVLDVKESDKTKNELENELGFTINEIIDVLDESPLLNEDLLLLSDKIAEYYLATKISVLQTMLPPSLSVRRSSLSAPKIAYEQYVVTIDNNEEELTHKQIELLRLISSEDKIKKREIKSLSILNKLIELGKVKIIKEEKRRLIIPEYEEETIKSLTCDQQKVIDEFNSSNDSIYLLQGVTGSGKTEVYLKLSEEVLSKGKSVLMLVPEISLTPMMMEYFIKRFKDNVAILHSELTPAEKYDEYRKIAKGECRIVVGARSAIFAPLTNIGLIILDEEHTESYKQDGEPFYHAREVAIMRGEMHHAKVLLGSATPSLESKARAMKGIYHYLELNKRINNQELPKTSIINMLDYRNIDRDSYILSKLLRASIKGVLDNKEQAILLLNRRGFSTHVSCRSCGHVFKCPNCGIALTYHKEDGMLKCHHCDYVELLPDSCPECGSKYLSKTGFGTERIEEEIHRLFPEAKTLRLDSDSAKVRTRIAKTIAQFANHEADILIGTQMIAKGHDFPLVTLVGVVLADIGLNMPNYRSSERAFQLITQAVGRSGRNERKGEAIIQTYMPDHYAITLAARQNYNLFYSTEMAMRKKQFYPPYCFLTSISITGKNEERVIEDAVRVAKYLGDEFKYDGVILGPVAPFISYENQYYSRTCLAKYKNKEVARIIFNKLQEKYRLISGVTIHINIDPYNF